MSTNGVQRLAANNNCPALGERHCNGTQPPSYHHRIASPPPAGNGAPHPQQQHPQQPQQPLPHAKHQQPPPAPQPGKMPGCVWTNEAVTLLLSLYLREQQLPRAQKLKKKDVWRGICAELWRRGLACSWQECDKKYRNLKQTFVRNLKQAGKKECRWIFFPLMLEINRHEPFVGDVLVGWRTSNVQTGAGGESLAALLGSPEPTLIADEDDDGEPPMMLMDECDDGAASHAYPTTPAPSPPPQVMNLSVAAGSAAEQHRCPVVAAAVRAVAAFAPTRYTDADETTNDDGYARSDGAAERRFSGDYAYATKRRRNSSRSSAAAIKCESPAPNGGSAGSGSAVFAPASGQQFKCSTSPFQGVQAPNHYQPPQQQQRNGAHSLLVEQPQQPTLLPIDIRLLQATMPFVNGASGSFAGPPPPTDSPGGRMQTPNGPQLNGAGCAGPSSGDRRPANDEEAVDDAFAEDRNNNCNPINRNENGGSSPATLGDGKPAACCTEQPPKWFNVFMAEFRRHEQRKLQQIAELCAEVRRTNDIEQQRNHILSEKNDILLRHMNAYMLHK